MNVKKLYMKSPCKGCPFTCGGINLSSDRAEEIKVSDTFICHEKYHNEGKRMQCAGHMKINKSGNIFYRLLRMGGAKEGEIIKGEVLTDKEYKLKHK